MNDARRQALLESALILLVFFIEGAYPVPDVNEPNYLGKAIHFWNPQWAAGDFFLDSADAHYVFYFTFGWLSLLLPPLALAWTGRLFTWALLAWAWRRLSWAVLPQRWYAVLTAALWVACLNRFHMAGEWVVGGVEAKGFAYVFYLLGLEALVLRRWNRAWMLFGVAGAFHVLVGGWAVVAAGMVWAASKLIERRWGSPAGSLPQGGPAGRSGADVPLVATTDAAKGDEPSGARAGLSDRDEDDLTSALPVKQAAAHPPAHNTEALAESAPPNRPLASLGQSAISPDGQAPAAAAPSLKAMAPALLIGGLLALPGLVPVWMLNWGADPRVVVEANKIYVFERLYHHLDPLQFPPQFVLRFVLLSAGWLLLCRLTPADAPRRMLRAMTLAALALALIGTACGLVSLVDRAAAAALLKYYWFRLSDAMVPMAAAFEAAALVAARRRFARGLGRWFWPTIITALAALHVADLAAIRPIPQAPRADKMPNYSHWRDLCDWIAASDAIAADALFLTPRQSHTFKWYAARPEVATWKELPQDAGAIVEWYRRMKEIYGTKRDDGTTKFLNWPDELPRQKIDRLAARYGFRYVVSSQRVRLPYRIVYQNESYVLYQLPDRKRPTAR